LAASAADDSSWAKGASFQRHEGVVSWEASNGLESHAKLAAVGAHLLVFIGVAAIVIVVPGPDTAVVTKNILVHGRRAALGTSLGVSAGLSVWTLAAAVGAASVLRASAVAFTALKLIGALYLVWLGLQALRAARHAAADLASVEASRPAMGALGGFRQGFLSDLANPKIGVFFTSLLPQFVEPGRPVLLPFLALGAVFVLMTALWLCAYCLMAARAAETLRRPRVKAALDRVTGIVLIALGLRLATEHR
jgi:RhtB (resistance to homoserine/threonine) family protein